MTNTAFKDLAISQEMQQAVKEMGFTQATPVQAMTIPALLNGKDVIGQAQTGTGKTAAFGIPLIEKVDTSAKHISAAIICPTRELAVQVCDELRKLSKFKKGMNILAVFGGDPINKQIKILRSNPNVIVATPGRLIDLMNRGNISLAKAETIVLDEADEMLSMGFRDEIEKILKTTPASRQTCLFSATLNKPVLEISRKYLKNPENMKVPSTNVTAEDISQTYCMTKPAGKTDYVSDLINDEDMKRVLLFCNTRRKVHSLSKQLKEKGFKADGIHGDLNQNQRNRVMGKFKKGQLRILVATDVASRGIDVKDIESVVNYDIPPDPDSYVHRIGRTGRAGSKGKAYTFITGKEMPMLRKIEKRTGVKMDKWMK